MAEVFTVLSFLNTISYTVALSYLISQFVRNRPFIITMMGLIGGTPFFDSRRPCLTSLTADLSTHLPVIIQLSFSMEASFSIPLAVFALALAHSISNRQRSARLVIYLSGLAIAFTPSLITVIAFFLSVSINFDFFTGYLPFMLLTFPRLRGAALSFIPVWMEYQQRDVSWPAATAFSNAIGILFLAVPFVFSLRFDAIFFRRIRTAIPTFVLLCALREGQDHFENDIALTGVVWPLLFVVFFALLEKFPKSPLFGLVKWVLIGYALVGGVIWLNTMATTKCPWVDSAALEFGKALDFCLDRKEIVLHNRRSFNPVSILAGRQVLLGNGVQIWRRGGAFHQQADISSLLMGEHNCIHQIMRDYNLSYIVEYRPRPFLLDNLSQWQYFNVIFQNEDWMLLRLDVSMIEQA
jgi:hypothetical protein